ncbi:hypothetical protein, partial [Escherichia coli]|uniref:hypothetical protein n=1 Tax=Escherichia coli TaxID=562 RepID=UPI001F4A48F3
LQHYPIFSESRTMQYKPLLLALMLGRRRVKTMGAARMCRRIWLTPTSTSAAIIPKQPVQKNAQQ